MSESPLERLEAILVELEVTPEALHRDREGRTWLPREAQTLVESSSECRDALDEFVEGELELWGAAVGRSAAPGSDPFFTARVVESLPTRCSGTALSPRRRAMVLGAFHVVAGLLAYLVLTMVPESTARWAEQAHDMLMWGSDGMGSMAMALGVTGVIGAVVIAVLAANTRSPAA